MRNVSCMRGNPTRLKLPPSLSFNNPARNSSKIGPFLVVWLALLITHLLNRVHWLEFRMKDTGQLRYSAARPPLGLGR